MKYKFIGNELFIANRIELSFDEKSVLILFFTLKEISLEDISMTLNISTKKVLKLIKQINNKLGYFFTINKYLRKNKFDSIYILKEK